MHQLIFSKKYHLRTCTEEKDSLQYTSKTVKKVFENIGPFGELKTCNKFSDQE